MYTPETLITKTIWTGPAKQRISQRIWWQGREFDGIQYKEDGTIDIWRYDGKGYVEEELTLKEIYGEEDKDGNFPLTGYEIVD